MPTSSDGPRSSNLPKTPEEQIERLYSELSNAVYHYRRLARRSYYFAVFLALLALVASGAAAVTGIVLKTPSEIVGLMALVPGAVAAFAAIMQPQGRANWHYRKKDRLNALRRRLIYGSPSAASSSTIAQVALAWEQINMDMNEEWEKKYTIDLSSFRGPGTKEPQPLPTAILTSNG